MTTRCAILLTALLAFLPARAADLGQGVGEMLDFGMYGKLALGMTLTAAEAPIAALAPAIAPPGPAAPGESVRIVGPYRWKDCLLDVSFYFRGPGPEGARRLQTVLLQTINDTQQLCRGQMEDKLDVDPLRANQMPPTEGRAYVTDDGEMKMALVWMNHSPPLMLFSSSAAINPHRSLPMIRIDALPRPQSNGIVTLSQSSGYLDRNPPDISFALAKEAAETALAACHQNRAAVAVAVLGPRGGLKVLLSSENNDPFDYTNGSAMHYDRVRAKAYTVLQTAKPSRDYTGKVLRANGGSTDGFLHAAPLSIADLAGGPGALPIRRGDVLAGVISVDGALNTRQNDDFDKDEACARAGIDKIKDRVAPR